MNNEQQPAPTEQPPQIPITPPIQPETKTKKRLVLIISAVVFVFLIGSGVAYAILKKSSPEKSKKSTQQVSTTPNTKASEQKDTIKLVKVAYTSTTPVGAQNSNDEPPVLAGGSYLELNGNGELTYNGTVLKKDSRIKDAVLSKNGKHYAYRLELSSQDYGQVPTKSELYIDNNKVAELGSSALLAIADNGKDYLVKTYTSKITPTIYNTGIREEVIKLNDTKNIVSSPYGFLSGQYSADAQNVLVQSRTNVSGSYWYYNNQKLANCSDDTNKIRLVATLSSDGKHTFCSAYTLGNAQSGSSLVYNITKLQSFFDDSSIAHNTSPIDADGIALTGFSDKSNWLLFVGADSVVTSDGAVKKLSDVSAEIAMALREKTCEGYSNLSNTNIVFASNDKFAVLVPCSSKKLFTKGFVFDTQPDLNSQKFLGMEYSDADKTIYVYAN